MYRSENAYPYPAHSTVPRYQVGPRGQRVVVDQPAPECCECVTSKKGRSAMGYFMKKFDSFLNKIFYRLGTSVATYTGYYIIVPIFITAILATGFQNIRYEDDPEYLFAPSNGKAKIERQTVEENFKINFTSNFHPSRVTRTGRFARFIIMAKDEGNLLRTEIWDDIMELDKIVKGTSVEIEGKKYNYNNLCAIWAEKCWDNSILGLHELMPEFEAGDFKLTYPIMLNPNNFELFMFPLFFGGIELSDNDTITSIKALSISYWLRTNDEDDDFRAAVFEQKLLDVFEKVEFEHINPSRFMSRTLENELEANTNSVTPYFGVTITVMVFFSVTTVMMADWVRSKPIMGLIGVISAVLSVIAAFGFLIYVRVPFIGINMAAPFLMLGIGIDDTFVMLAAWRRTRIQDSVKQRLAETYAEAAVSITITSITDMISFFIGVITPFPSVQIFCIYTGTAVLLTYLWHITLFGACLAVAGYAEKGQRHALFCHKVVSKSEAAESKNCMYSIFCAGGINKADPWNPEDNKPHMLMSFFKNYVARFLNIPAIKAFVVMIFVIYLAGGLWGCTMVKEGLERRRLSRYDSYSVKFYDMEDEYFRDYPYRVQVVLTGDIDYSDPEVRKEIMKVHETFENQSFVAGNLYSESWMRNFFTYIDKTGDYIDWNITDQASFVASLRKEYFLEDTGDTNQLDVAFNEDYTKIVASRFIIQTYKIKDGNADKEMMETLRKLAEDSPFNVTVFNPFFIFFDQYSLVRTTSLQAVCLAAAVMMLVSLIFIPNPLCSLWVAFSIISIEIGVVGYMTLWDVSLDSISMINLIMCIGFSVDFSAHICYAYLSAKVDTPAERVEECLYSLGVPILQGGLSTILGIMALILAPSYIFITFFKTVFLVIFFGAMHGIFLLPVLLSLLGPGSCKSKKNKNKVTPPHPLFLENMTLPPGPHPPMGVQMLHDGVKIPRPQAGTPKLNGTYVANETGNKDGIILDKDLGIGTSGEDSSESSLSKEPTSKKGSASQSHKHERQDRSVPILEVYSNNGYISDDLEAEERRAQERRSRHGEYDNLKMYRHSEYGTRRQHDRQRPQYASARSHPHSLNSQTPPDNYKGQRRSKR